MHGSDLLVGRLSIASATPPARAMNHISHLALQEVRLAIGGNWVCLGDGLHFAFIRTGTLHCTSTAESKLIAGGDVVVMTASGKAALTPSRGREATFAWFCTRLDHLYPLFESTEISQLNRVAERFLLPRHYPRQSELAIDCHRLLADVPRALTLEHRSHLLRLVSNILTAELALLEPPRAHSAGPDAHFFRVVEQLSPEEFVELRVEDLARRFGYGRRHLSRLFHRHFGTSVAAMRMELRLTKAISLLRDPDTKITAIASDCGFNHLGLFNSCFKKRFGVSPGAWRKEKLASGKSMEGPQANATAASLADLVTPKSPSVPLRAEDASRNFPAAADGSGASQGAMPSVVNLAANSPLSQPVASQTPNWRVRRGSTL